MAKFEHCRLFIYTGGSGPDTEVLVHYYDSGQGPQHLGYTGHNTARRDDALQQGFKDLGANGWELVTVVYSPDVAERLSYYFKRRVQ